MLLNCLHGVLCRLDAMVSATSPPLRSMSAESSRLSDSDSSLLRAIEGLEELFSSQPESLANRPVSPGRERAQKMTVGSGQKLLGFYLNLKQNAPSLRTLSEYLLLKTDWYSRICFLKWKVKGTRFNRILYQLAASVPSIDEIESGLLPTASTKDISGGAVIAEKTDKGWKRTSKHGKSHGAQLHDVMKTMSLMLGTPTQLDAVGTVRRSKKFQTKIPTPTEAIQMLPTPRSHEAGNYQNQKDGTTQPTLSGAVAMLPTPSNRDDKGLHANNSEAFQARQKHPRGVPLTEHLQRNGIIGKHPGLKLQPS